MDLQGRKILFFAPKLFGIPERIQSQLQASGATVDYFDERPGNNFLTKALIRINRNLISRYINKYHSEIIDKTKDKKYDYIFFIKGESFSEHNLKKLLDNHPESKSIVYHWDSIRNNPNALNLLDSFDYRFSFDKKDCDKFNMEFLPLFYYDDYSSIPPITSPSEYTLLFIGTTHSDRYRIVERLAQQIARQDKKSFRYYYFQGKIMFYKYLVTHKECKGIDRSVVHFSPINEAELMDLYGKSSIVLDINHPKQTGLTLRCIESLGARRKLVTTNQDIVNYDFFNPNNILVVDRTMPNVPVSFIEAPYEEVPEEIYKKYSLSTWCNRIFR